MGDNEVGAGRIQLGDIFIGIGTRDDANMRVRVPTGQGQKHIDAVVIGCDD